MKSENGYWICGNNKWHKTIYSKKEAKAISKSLKKGKFKMDKVKIILNKFFNIVEKVILIETTILAGLLMYLLIKVIF